MPFTVTWLPWAQAKLADIWTRFPDRAAISAAANYIDQILGTDPQKKGWPYGKVAHHDARHLVVYPLEVIFLVIPQDRMAKVVYVRHV